MFLKCHDLLTGINMKYLASILLIWLMLPAIGFGQSRTVTIASTDIVLEDSDLSFDLAASGKWFIQFSQDDWLKLHKTLYPVKTDRTRAVSDAQDAVKANLDIYVIQALQGGHYTRKKGSGVTLSARTVITYDAVSIEPGMPIKIYVRNNNKQYTLTLYPDPSDENATAITAKADLMTELGIIESAAKAGSFYE